jgi:hypothetical protein
MPDTIKYIGPLESQGENKIKYLGPLEETSPIPSEPSFIKDVVLQTTKDIGKEISGIPSAVGNAFIGATKGRALPATIAQMGAMPFAGLTALLGYEPGKAEEIGIRYEEQMEKLTPNLYPEEQEGMEQIGKLFKPIEMAGTGYRKMAEMVPQVPAKVKTIPYVGKALTKMRDILEPSAETIGQAATLGAYGGAGLKALKARGEAGARGIAAPKIEARMPAEKTVPITTEGKPVSISKVAGEAVANPQPTPPIAPPVEKMKQIGQEEPKQTELQVGLNKLAQEQNKQVQTGAITLPKKKTSTSPEVSFDPEVERAYQKSVAQPEPLFLKVKDTFQSIWHKASREYEYLPKGAKFAEARFGLKQLEKQKGAAQDRTIRGIGEVLSGLDKNEYDVFTRKVILNDLTNEANVGHDLPWGLTHESLIKEKIKFDSVVEGSPKVQDALIKRQVVWDNLKTRYTKAMDDIGIDISDKIKNENYFRHQVLEYINLNGIFGTGKKLKSPTYRGFLQKRKGSSLDINRDYLQPETEVMAQMNYDIEVANTIKRIDKHYNIADTVRKSAKAKGIENWRNEIPDGYTIWQPKEGNVFYMADSIPAKLAEQLKSGALEELGITVDDLKQVVAKGGKRKEFVIPNELASTLDELVKQKTGSVLANADRKILKGWKIWTLISPRRYFKYNFRNLTGDADAAFVGNSSGFKKTPQATQELYDVIVNKKQMTPDMQDWFDRGGMQSNLQAQEMGEFKNLWMFKRLYEPTKGIKDLPVELWKKYWRGARISTDIRESVLRYANYLDYLEQIKKSPEGKPNNFGASIPEEIMGLSNPKDKAYWLSNDLLGAYDRVSVMGQNLREYWAPFWSWKEVNFKRYIQFSKNSVSDGKLTELIGRKAAATAIKSPYIAYRVGSFMVKATALWSGLQVWNHTRFPNEEKELSVEERSKPHVILGRDKDGKIISFNRMGALGDFLEWFGLDTAPHYVDAWFQGKMTLKDIAKDMAKSPVNVATSIITPFIKTPAELATRRTLYPDITRPGTIRDKGLYLARNLGLENEYIALTGKPSEGYRKSLTKAFVYATDPGQVAYSTVFDLKNEFLKKLGNGAEGFWLTRRGGTLYNLKLAMRYKDKEATDKYLGEYAKMGGTREGLKSSLAFMNPLSGMTKKEQTAFVLSLNDEDKKTLGRAINFYSTTLLGNNKEVQQ